MRNKKWFRPGWLAAVAALCVIPFAAHAQEMDIRDFVRQTFIHGVPYEKARQYGGDAVPTLLELLRDPEAGSYRANVVTVLGMIGDPRAVTPLIGYLEADGVDDGKLTTQAYAAKTSVLFALGYVAHASGDARALRYLSRSVDPATWSERGIKWMPPFFDDPRQRDFELGKLAILGLGLSGKPEAADVLQRLQRPDTRKKMELPKEYAGQIDNVVSEALKAYGEIAEEGMAAYYRKNRLN